MIVTEDEAGNVITGITNMVFLSHNHQQEYPVGCNGSRPTTHRSKGKIPHAPEYEIPTHLQNRRRLSHDVSSYHEAWSGQGPLTSMDAQGLSVEKRQRKSGQCSLRPDHEFLVSSS